MNNEMACSVNNVTNAASLSVILGVLPVVAETILERSA
jgi:hypothetical protein